MKDKYVMTFDRKEWNLTTMKEDLIKKFYDDRISKIKQRRICFVKETYPNDKNITIKASKKKLIKSCKDVLLDDE